MTTPTRVIRLDDSDSIGPIQAVVVAVAIAVLLGGTLLLSAPPTTELMEGAVPWKEGSPLQSLVGLLCLNYQSGTAYPDTIKNYVLGIGAAVAAIAVGIQLLAGRREGNDDVAAPVSEDGVGATRAVSPLARRKSHVSPIVSALILSALFLMWSFASSRWSAAPELAIGGSLLVTGWFLWSASLGAVLRGRAVLAIVAVMIVITGAASAIAIWYFHGRNPGLRAMFPFGNPSLLATCLLPGILLSLCMVVGLIGPSSLKRVSKLLGIVGCAVVVALAGWASWLADSRGPAVGLLFGFLALAFFAARGRSKFAILAIAAAVSMAGWWYLGSVANEVSPTGRSATLRFRLYAWDYAWQMFLARPLTGFGQGGYVLLGDAFVVDDVLRDPLVFGSRIAHAHNEWLEIMADLGAVGLVLMAGALLLSLDGAVARLRESMSRERRWALIGLSASLIALMAAECFGVGLRVAGVPTWFFTILGLIWAMVGAGRRGMLSWAHGSSAKRGSFGVLAVALGLLTLVVTQQDWSAARNDRRSREALAGGDWQGAIRLAEQAVSRLDPQRALTSLARLAEARLHVARQAQERAFDRESRLATGDASPDRLIDLALEDVDLSQRQCMDASHALKELVQRSPGFIGSGRLEYGLNLLQARNIEIVARLVHAAREWGRDVRPAPTDDAAPFIGNALRAIERELQRQPFHVGQAMEFAQVADYEAQAEQVIDMLARALRHNPMPGEYTGLLTTLGRSVTFAETFHRSIAEALRGVGEPPPRDESGGIVERWLPEKVRLGAAVQSAGGRPDGALAMLESALPVYERLAGIAPMGAAAFFAELAEARFHVFFDSPATAIEAAERSLDVAPRSGPGRDLARSVRLRLADYHLVMNDETAALAQLRFALPPGAAADAVQTLLASRYRRVGEVAIARPGVDPELVGPPYDPVLERAIEWAAKSIELDPSDPLNELLAARATLLRGDLESMSAHAERALRLGARVEAVRSLALVASEWNPGAKSVVRLLSVLGDDRANEDADP